MNPSSENIQLYRSLFKSREDVFATRWEKGGKSGYMPAYTFDPYMYKMHRIKGGTFQNFTGKHYQPFTNEQLIKHLSGEQFIGIYPLIPDHTSWFIAADFDDENWLEDCRKFIKICNDKNIPAYLERSRSGKGGHVWIFFEKPYPAFRSRKIIAALLEQSGVFSTFDKHSSFDRLFPNQDYLSGKGLGNLIALPLNKICLEEGNNCFINPENLQPIADQWSFLASINRITAERLDDLYNQISTNNSTGKPGSPGKLNIQLGNALYLNRNGLNTQLINYLKEELNFSNTAYFAKKNSGKNTWGTDRYFKMIVENEHEIIIPRGFAGKLVRFCKEQKIQHELIDERKKLKDISFSENIELREHQKPAAEAASKKDFGVIVAPPGTGKTIIALSIIASKRQPALIIVHRKQLAEQWAERIEAFLNIPKREIGKIGQGKNKVGDAITIATVQSLEKSVQSEEAEKYLRAFGIIIVDECHHVPAETFRKTISRFHSFYMYGLTATPFRKYNDGKLIFIHLGEIISEVKAPEIGASARARIIVRNTELQIPFNYKTDKFETLSKVLVHDSARNRLILDNVVAELNRGKKVAIITERKEHINALFQYLKQKHEIITLSGDDNEAVKAAKWKTLKEGSFQALITTGQYFGEGSDLQNIECLFLVYPFSFEGKLIQYIGRGQRSEITPTIYDFRDSRIDYLEKLFQKRNEYYKSIYLHESLFNQPEIDNSPSSFIYEQRLSIPIEQLEFRYGSIAFKHTIPELAQEVRFEVENPEIRPEFEVMKSYFSKVLKSKKIKVDVLAKFHNGVPLVQQAKSYDLGKINREIIDSVKFQFISKGIINKPTQQNENLLDLAELQGGKGQPTIYKSENELLDDILKNIKVKHHRQLVYLSQKHESSMLKLRFVLSPFSFVFLVSGKRQYHIIWETLDTEEATYIWHTDKNLSSLKASLKQIDLDIGRIRQHGRQKYFDSPKQNFSRVVHDYSDEKKGFVIWKDLLEERLL